MKLSDKIEKNFFAGEIIDVKYIKEFILELKKEMKHSCEIDDSWEGIEYSINKLAGDALVLEDVE